MVAGQLKYHLDPQVGGSEKDTGDGLDFWNLKAHLQ